jgi:hypothetical protein
MCGTSSVKELTTTGRRSTLAQAADVIDAVLSRNEFPDWLPAQPASGREATELVTLYVLFHEGNAAALADRVTLAAYETIGQLLALRAAHPSVRLLIDVRRDRQIVLFAAYLTVSKIRLPLARANDFCHFRVLSPRFTAFRPNKTPMLSDTRENMGGTNHGASIE